ncbi:MAG: hypothetical protein AAF517_09485 [Planctomycetota bacterium]
MANDGSKGRRGSRGRNIAGTLVTLGLLASFGLGGTLYYLRIASMEGAQEDLKGYNGLVLLYLAGATQETNASGALAVIDEISLRGGPIEFRTGGELRLGTERISAHLAGGVRGGTWTPSLASEVRGTWTLEPESQFSPRVVLAIDLTVPTQGTDPVSFHARFLLPAQRPDEASGDGRWSFDGQWLVGEDLRGGGESTIGTARLSLRTGVDREAIHSEGASN